MTESIEQSSFSRMSMPTSDGDSIRFRLDPNPLLRRLQVYLLGVMEVVEEDEHGSVVRKLKRAGNPKVNDLGYQAIMFQVESVVNTMTVQGNLSDEMYLDFVADFHSSITNDLWVNSYKYGLKDHDYNGVVLAITNMVRLFVTRPIANKERESLTQSQSVSERVISQPPQKNDKSFWRFIPGL